MVSGFQSEQTDVNTYTRRCESTTPPFSLGSMRQVLAACQFGIMTVLTYLHIALAKEGTALQGKTVLKNLLVRLHTRTRRHFFRDPLLPVGMLADLPHILQALDGHGYIGRVVEILQANDHVSTRTSILCSTTGDSHSDQ